MGSDLVCVGEQPLHAVPLLKFHNKDVSPSAADDYSMPHWINLSFYSTNKKVAYSTFIPRIKLPPLYVNGAISEAKVIRKLSTLSRSFIHILYDRKSTSSSLATRIKPNTYTTRFSIMTPTMLRSLRFHQRMAPVHCKGLLGPKRLPFLVLRVSDVD